jgi:ATP-dependent Zn protease
MGHEADYSEDVARQIDREIQTLVEAAHIEAREILTLHRSVLDRLAEGLIVHESLDGDVLDEILAGAGGSVADSPGSVAGAAILEPQAPAEQMRAEGID